MFPYWQNSFVRTIHKLSLWLYTWTSFIIWLFWQILISCCKCLMPIPLKWRLLGAHTIILSKNIHKVTRTCYVWFEFLWSRRYLTWCTVGTDINSGNLFKWALHSLWYYVSDFSYNNQVSNVESFHLNLYILLNLRLQKCARITKVLQNFARFSSLQQILQKHLPHYLQLTY